MKNYIFASSMLLEIPGNPMTTTLHNRLDIRRSQSKESAIGEALSDAVDKHPGARLLDIQTLNVSDLLCRCGDAADTIEGLPHHTNGA